MGSEFIVLNTDIAAKKLSIFNKSFPLQKLNDYYCFDFNKSTDENLSSLALWSLNQDYTVPHLFIYNDLFLDCCSRWISGQDSHYFVQIINALGRIISLFPESSQLTEHFLSKNFDYLDAILQTYETQETNDIETILLSYYRLLDYDRIRFEKYLKAVTLYNLLKHDSNVVKFLSLKLISLQVNMSESAYETIKSKHLDPSSFPILGFYEGSQNINFEFLELNEAKRLSNFSRLPISMSETCNVVEGARHQYLIDTNGLSSHIVNVSGVLVPRISDLHEVSYSGESVLVKTDNVTKTMTTLSKQLQRNEPVMVIGKAGSGKTFLINEIAKSLGCHKNMVKIHLGEQTDAKLLLGTYTSGEKPGTFEWRSGVLTTAIQEGRWVLIEDIDKAPTEVLSVLLNLLEKREILIPSRGETIRAANGFQLISTITVDDSYNKGDSNFQPDLIGIRLWKKVYTHEPSDDELKKILPSRFQILSGLIKKLIGTYNSVKEIYNNPKFVSLNKGVHPRVVSLRDLIKLCERLATLFEKNNVIEPNQLIESSVYDDVFAETVDCFVGSIAEHKAIEPLVHAIGENLEIPASRISLFLDKHIPLFEDKGEELQIGRAALVKSKISLQKKSSNSTSFARTNHSLRLMEQIGVAVHMCEPVLLVGETGTGKTTVVQQVAKLMNKTLTVINVSQQTESGDLLGGYKPVNCKTVAIPLLEEFELLFPLTFSMKKNEKFYKLFHKCFSKSQWKNVIKIWKEAVKMAEKILNKEDTKEDGKNTNKKRKINEDNRDILLDKWRAFDEMINGFKVQFSSIENSFVFDFVEGSLIKAVRNGDWVLLDEVNLASADTLENIADLLSEVESRSILLSEKGEAESIVAHKDFRIFACMNPATDVGKRDLPSGIRSKFTEIYVHSPDRDISDLLSIIDKYILKYSVNDEWVGNDIAELYLEAKRLAECNQIVDGSNQRPHFSIRTLTRTLLYTTDIAHIYGLRRSLYEGFSMAFLTLLDKKSEDILKPLIEKYTLGRLKNSKSVVSQIPPSPGPEYVQFRHYWMKRGPSELLEQPHYIITPFVEKNMLNLVRATSGKRFPVLIQGPTSAGKTSMIKYLADITGHKFVRINNHEHTDLQEYLGTYVTDETGKLSFKEGVLVEALRKGYWIVLDELNLAPTDVLEALNRLLDDNRELFIPETQEVVHPHPDFMLFATQNPAGIYGGRKVLSRAFRNRFLELHFDDIPQDELEIILKQRCQIAPSYAKKIVDVYRQLSIQRSANRLFEQKNSFATLRDLFRWALREAVGYEELAANGYMLLAERCRSAEERLLVKSVLEKVMKVKLDMDSYYRGLEDSRLMVVESSVVWTKSLRKLAVLVEQCLKNNEPVLLVGETGCGKTTVCQLIAKYLGKELITINAHQNTETGDILGAQRPVRNRSSIQASLIALLKEATRVDSNELMLDNLLSLYDQMDKSFISENIQGKIASYRDSLKILFEWCDGPLIHAMKSGNFFLLDEISLADDSVLERLNSVLEPERGLLLAEKGSVDAYITAAPSFQFFATMNPGGDYGKKELSPALKNRFTEIWVPSMEDFNDVFTIVSDKLNDDLQNLATPIVEFSKWYANKFGGGKTNSGVISLRDILAWVDFINSAYSSLSNPNACLIHGAAMVFIDAIGTNNTAYLAESEERLRQQKDMCVNQLSELVGEDLQPYFNQQCTVSVSNSALRSGVFEISRNERGLTNNSFNLSAPTTSSNLMRVIRALQVHKPVLLEGSPGVGKTSLVSALAELTGNILTRINLSEQTDLVDLFGFDAPGERTGEFSWRDAPFLRAMQKGEWVLLDEMNLASQSVLEGLNACLDHRGEAYVPELDKVFTRHPNFIVFAAQNPQYQGGGRKGLPKSFVNRFSVVYVDMLKPDDLLQISSHLYPNIDKDTCSKMIQMMSTLEDEVVNKKLWAASGAPWEFNLRDTLRWLKLLNSVTFCEDISAADFLEMLVTQRFRTSEDRARSSNLISSIFGLVQKRSPYLQITDSYLQVNGEIVDRMPLLQTCSSKHLVPLQSNLFIYESMLRCIKNNWPLILVGPSNSGKTEIIRLVSSILGTKTLEFSMNSDVDSMDILGGYEQVDLTKKISSITERLDIILRELLVTNISEGSPQEAMSSAFMLLDFISKNLISDKNYNEFESLFERVFSYVNTHESLALLFEEAKAMKNMLEKERSVKFEWFDGLLVKAVENGEWLILDNANLCSPSVLDRINSLLETNGSLVINECSLADGQPRVVRPHPNFRLFLTVDPKYGELSRAMRNRGIEIYVDDLKVRSSEYDTMVLGLDSLEGKRVHSVESGFKQLALDDVPIPLTKPVSAFISPRVSGLLPFAKIHDSILLGEPAPSIVSTIPHSLVPMVQNWAQNVINSNIFEEKELIQKMSQTTNFLVDKYTLSQLKSLYEPLRNLSEQLISYPERFVVSQSLIPILNSYIKATLKRTNEFSVSSEAFYLFDMAWLAVNAANKLEFAKSRSLHGKANELTYLEQAAAVGFGRNVKNPPRIPIFNFLQTLLLTICKCFEPTALFSNENLYRLHFGLYIIWVEAYNHSNSKKDDAKLRVYQELLELWFSKAERLGIELSEVREMMLGFGKSLELKSGRSMSKLWEQYRSSYPSSSAGWTNMQELEIVAKEFDGIVKKQFSDSYGVIQDLTDVLASLNNSILESKNINVDETLGKIKSGVAELDTISSKFLVKRKHFFTDEFTSLLRYIFYVGPVERELISDVRFNADISTMTLIKYFTNSYVYPTSLELMWVPKDGKYTSYASSLFSPSLVDGVIRKSSNFKSFAGGQIDQTITDAKQLGKSLLKSSKYILQDQIKVYSDMLKDWILDIITLHATGTVPVLESIGYEYLNKKVAEECPPYFFDIFESLLLPALIIVQSESHSTTLLSLGKAWVMFATALLQLYVPNSPYDPAIRDHVMYENFVAHKKLSSELVDSWKTISKVLFDTQNDNMISNLSEDEENLEPKKPRVYRPLTSANNLFDEWEAFMTSTVDVKPIEALLDSAINYSELSADKLMMFEQNTSQFLSRISKMHRYYSDLNEIFQGYVYAMKFGFNVIELSQKEKSRKLTLEPLFFVDPLKLLNEEESVNAFQQLGAYFKNRNIEALAVDQVLIFFLELYRIHGKGSSNLSVFNEALQNLYYRWSARRMKEDQAAQQNDSIFKFNDNFEDNEAEFRRLFPEFEDTESFTISDGKNARGCDDVYYEVAQTFISLFSRSTELKLPELLHKGSEVSRILLETFKEFRDNRINHVHLLAAVNGLAKEVSAFSTPTESSKLNFYQDYFFSESKKSIKIVHNLWSVVVDLRKQWPEHATLIELSRICDEYMQFSSETPLARLLQKIEQIYTFVVEWEKYASSKVSLNKNVTELTALVVSWRKLELHTWKALFDFEDLTNRKSLGKWWFYLFETIVLSNLSVQGSYDRADLSPLISSLNLFMSKSTYGEFSYRILLLKSFAKYAKLLELKEGAISEALNNIIVFYSQFEPIISEQMKATKKVLEKEISEVILLASWKDVNIDALKQSSRRSHNSLYKIVRKYRELLASQASGIIETGVDPRTKISRAFSPVPVSECKTIDIQSSKLLVEQISSWSQRSNLLKNIDMVEKNLSVYSSRITKMAYPDLLQLARSIAAESKRLKEETPKVYAKDKKKLLATLMTQKRKLLSDTIKELKRVGLKASFRQDIHKAQESVTSILSNMHSFCGTSLENCDQYFFRILEILPRLKTCVAGPADDVPLADIEKSMAMMENLVFSLIANREPILKVSTDLEKLKILRSELEYLALNYKGDHDVTLSKSLLLLQNISSLLPSLIDYLIESLNNSTFMAGFEHDIAFLSMAKQEFIVFYEKSEEIKFCDSTAVELFKAFKDYVVLFLSELERRRKGPCGFIYQLAISWLEENMNVAQIDPPEVEFSLQIIDEKLRKIHTNIMLSVQKLIQECDNDLCEDDDKWFTETNRRIFKNLKLSNSTRILEQISDFIYMVRNSSFSSSEGELLKAAVAFTMPVINHYYKLLSSIVYSASSNYEKTSNSSYIFAVMLYNIAKDGFCSPEPPSEEMEDNNLQEGTGLGDGDGAQNNSKDVEEDEDLLEDAQNPNKEQNDNEDDKCDQEDDAVDMQGDIAGELENLSDQDNGDDQEQESEDELDEEIDNLDEDDPNALDEKMWDEEAPDNSREKDSEQVPENSNTDDMQATEEDNEKQNMEKKENSDEQSLEAENHEDEQTHEEAESEEDVGEQDDEVKNEERDELEDNVPEVETMDLPEDMNLDSGEEKEDEGEVSDESENDDLDDRMDIDDAEDDNQFSKEKQDEPEEDQNESTAETDVEDGLDAEHDTDDKTEEAEQASEDDNENGPQADEEMEDGDQSEQELLEDEEESGKKQGEEEVDNDVEGMDAVEDLLDDKADMDLDAAIQQDAGARGTGTEVADDDDEKNDIGSSGSAQTQVQEQNQDEVKETSRKEAQESLKQLGDSLKEFHRRHQEINEASTNDELKQEQGANERPDEFEHVDGANTETDTQALGAADMDQLTNFDEENAIDDDLEMEDAPEDNTVNEMSNDNNTLNEEPIQEEHTKDDQDNNGKTRGAFIGERNEFLEEDVHWKHDMMKEEENDLDEILGNIDNEVQAEIVNLTPARSLDEARELWKKSEIETSDLAAGLSEQLRLILEPTLATKLRGDYKTGKRLNMKRIIPYIASQYRKDKIWLRRTKPSKRQYQIMIAVDNSKSMSESNAVDLAFQSICLVSKALTQLESGGLSIVKFGELTQEVHSFDQQFSNESGSKVFQWFDFQDTRTNVKKLVGESLQIFERARALQNNDLWQLEIIISDGVCEDHETLVRLVRRARENKIMLVFVIIDGINANQSIMDMSQVKYVPDQFGNLQLTVEKYLDTFPFEFYVVVHDISELPEMISVILRQYFSEMASM